MIDVLDLLKKAIRDNNKSEAKRLASQLPDSEMGEYAKLIAKLQSEDYDSTHVPILEK